MTPKVSIIMPVKNVEAYIHDCLTSIQSQSFTDWELIIVNDNATDTTQEILSAFATKDPRIQSLANQGKGIILALQLALTQAKGEFITRFDGDDIMPEHRLTLMVEGLQSTAPKTIVTGKVKYISDSPISKGYQTYEQWLNERIDRNDHWDWVYRECVIASPNWIMRRQELVDMEPFSQPVYPEDYDLVLNWYRQKFNVFGLKETTLYWREHQQRTSRKSSQYNQEHFFRLKMKHFIKNEGDKHDLILWGTDTKGKLTASLLQEMKVDFTWMDLPGAKLGVTLLGQTIKDYRKVEKRTNFKLLISVFPATHQKVVLERYLHNLKLKQGRDYHYL